MGGILVSDLLAMRARRRRGDRALRLRHGRLPRAAVAHGEHSRNADRMAGDQSRGANRSGAEGHGRGARARRRPRPGSRVAASPQPVAGGARPAAAIDRRAGPRLHAGAVAVFGALRRPVVLWPRSGGQRAGRADPRVADRRPRRRRQQHRTIELGRAPARRRPDRRRRHASRRRAARQPACDRRHGRRRRRARQRRSGRGGPGGDLHRREAAAAAKGRRRARGVRRSRRARRRAVSRA